MPTEVTDWLAGLSPLAVLLALVTIIGGWLLARIARRGMAALLSRLRGLSPAAAGLVARITYYSVLLLAAGVAITFLGAPVEPLLTAALIVGVVVALALRGISDNFACDPVDGATITSDVVAESLRSRGHSVVATSAVPEPPLTPPPAL